MVSYLQIHPKKVGVHPCNRYGFGLQVNNVHRLGARIVGMGWSWEACSLAIAMRSGGTSKIADFTVNLQAGSKKLGRNNPQEIDFGSLACGHTNQFLVACIDQVPTDEEALQGPDGCISMEKLMKNDKTGKLKEALEKGMKWTIIDSRAEDMYGSALPNLVQRARQAVGQVQNEESLIEMCLEIQGMAAQMQREGQVPDFDVIAEIVGESQVKHPEDIPIACAFVQKFGGGKEGQYIADLAKFVALCVPANRKVEASKLDAFVNLKLEAAELCPEFVIASLKMDFDCPQDKCKNGVCNFLQTSIIGRLAGTQKAAMIEANAHLRTFKKSMSKLKFLDPDDAILHSGIADAVVARIVYTLPLPKKFEGKTVCAALRLIIRELKILCKSNIDNPFDEGESDEEGEQEEGKKEASEKPSSSTRHLIEYNAAGQAVGTERSTLESQGFVVNANVERIAGGHKKIIEYNVNDYYDNDDNKNYNARRESAPHYGRARRWHCEDEGVRRRRYATEKGVVVAIRRLHREVQIDNEGPRNHARLLGATYRGQAIVYRNRYGKPSAVRSQQVLRNLGAARRGVANEASPRVVCKRSISEGRIRIGSVGQGHAH